MAFVLVVTGLLMIVTGAKGTYAQFGSKIAGDFTGPGNFTYWVAAIGAIGAIGYIDRLRTFSRYFMALIIISMVLANKGFFAKFTAALKAGPTAPSPVASSSTSGTGTNTIAAVKASGGPMTSDVTAMDNANKQAGPQSFTDILGRIFSTPAY